MYIIFSYLYFNCFFRSCIFFSSNLIILFRVYCCVGCLFHLFFYFVFLASFSRFLIIVFLQLLASLIGWLFMFHFSFFFFIFCLNDNSCDSFLVSFLFFSMYFSMIFVCLNDLLIDCFYFNCFLFCLCGCSCYSFLVRCLFLWRNPWQKLVLQVYYICFIVFAHY